MFYLKFYADKQGKYENKYFCFLGSPYRLEAMLYIFVSRGNKIRSCFIQPANNPVSQRVTNEEISEIVQSVSLSIQSGNSQVITEIQAIYDSFWKPKPF